MAVKDWHPGKIGLMWAAYLFLLWVLLDPYTRIFGGYVRTREDSLLLWTILTVPGLVITWRWFSGREKKK